MYGLWLEDQRLALRDDLPIPVPPAGEALIRVRRAGICNTDLEMVRGYYPFTGILGHEFVGIVESPGDWHGMRVCGEINATCGECAQCLAGRKTHCERRTVLGIKNRNGAFAEYLTLPVDNLHAVPNGVPDNEAVYTEPLAAALEITQRVSVRPNDKVVVLGDGKLGLLSALVLDQTGCSLTAVGRHRNKLDVLAARGIRTALVGDPLDLKADIVVECTGNPSGFELARKLLRAQGTLVLKSTYAGTASVDLSWVVVDEITVAGSRCGPFAPALDLLARRAVDVRPLTHARYPLKDGMAAMEHAARPGVLKVLLEIS